MRLLSFFRTGSSVWKDHLKLPMPAVVEQIGPPDRIDLVWVLVGQKGEEERIRWNLGRRFRVKRAKDSDTGDLLLTLEDRMPRKGFQRFVPAVVIPLYSWSRPLPASRTGPDDPE